jgi:hypothetical protein
VYIVVVVKHRLVLHSIVRIRGPVVVSRRRRMELSCPHRHRWCSSGSGSHEHPGLLLVQRRGNQRPGSNARKETCRVAYTTPRSSSAHSFSSPTVFGRCGSWRACMHVPTLNLDDCCLLPSTGNNY